MPTVAFHTNLVYYATKAIGPVESEMTSQMMIRRINNERTLVISDRQVIHFSGDGIEMPELNTQYTALVQHYSTILPQRQRTGGYG